MPLPFVNKNAGLSVDDQRQIVVNEAQKWINTPYLSNADVCGAGVDCGMLLVRVFVDAGFVAPFDPRPYPAQWALHQSAEIYLSIVQQFTTEITPQKPLPGDIALFKFGRCYAHGAIVTEWPWLIHANPNADRRAPCRVDNAETNSDLMFRPPRFFTIFAATTREQR